MSNTVNFSDNLGNGTITGGRGLLGFAKVGFWYYARHGGECKPGKWQVKLHGGINMGEFWRLCQEADAVVDDFGNLVRVQ